MFRRGTHKSGLKARKHGALFVALGLVAGVTAVAADIATPGTNAPVRAAGSVIEDNFSTNNYAGGTAVGSESWSGPWLETNDAGNPDFSSGFITGDTGALRLTDLDNNSRSVQRAVDLSGFDIGATLSFTVNSKAGNEGLDVEFRTGDNPGDFAQLTRFPFTNTIPPVNTRYTFVLDQNMIRQNGELRFSGFDGWEDDDVWVIDDIVIDNPVPNPDLANSCGTELTVILDESGSIESPGNAVTLVEDAVDALAQGLVGTGSTLRIVEFSTDARDAQIPAGTTTAQDVTQAYVDGALNTYLKTPNVVGASLPTDYEPNNAQGLTQTFTNWEAGLFRAGKVPAPGPNADVTPLVLFITDGDPNTVGTPGSSTQANLGGTGEAFNVAAAAASYQEAAALKQAGAHVIGVGVGRAATNAPSFARLTEIVESQNPEIWTNQPGEPLNIQTVDAIQVNTFEALADALRQAVSELCSQSLDITKVDDTGAPIEGRSFTTTVTGSPGANAFAFVDPAGPAQSSTVVTDATGDASFQWSPVGFVADPNAWSSTATFTEQLPPGWTLPDVPGTCTVAPGGANAPLSAVVDANGIATFTVGHTFQAGETVSCEVVNNRPGTIEVEKLTEPATTELFTFTPGGWNNNATFQLSDGGTFTSGDLSAGGAYTIAETALPDGWALLPGTVCTTPGEADSPITGVLVAPGKVTTCTFNNREAATLTVEKQTLPDGDPTLFTFTPGGWNGDADFTLADGVTKVSGDLSPGTYTITETVPALWDLTSVSCTDADTQTPGTQVTLAAGDDVTCVFTNTKKGVLTIDKDLVDDAQPVSTGGNNFTVAYDLVVTNPGPGTNTYTLTDTPNFGDGTTINSITATGPDGDITLDPPVDGVYTLTTDNEIAADTTETYTVTVAFTVAADMAATERTCDNGSVTNGQGTFNSATITFTGGQDTDTDCADIPPALTIDKNLIDDNQPVSTGLGEYTVSYFIDVTNPGSGPGTYDLTDTPVFGTGADIDTFEVKNPGAADFVTVDPSGDVYTLATDDTIPAGTTERYEVRIAFTVAADMAATERTCDNGSVTNGQGTFNSATITFTGGQDTDTDCADIPPALTIDKNLIDDNQPVSTGGNNFTVAYDLVVTNPGPGTNTYTLTDTPNFGDGTTITSITVTGPDGDITLDPPVDGVYTLTTTNPIAAATTETYTVTVAFTVAADMAATERTCDNGSVTNGQGTFNSATITFTGGQDTDTDCADIPPALTIDKNLIDDNQPVSTGGNNFTVAYDLVVTNPGPGTNTYTLTDTPNFGDGTTITSITVTGPDGDITLDPPVDGVYTLTTTNPIAAATTETYTVTVAFTVAADMAATERTCDNGSVTNGQGTFNSATITFTGGQDTDTDCADIPPALTIDKNLIDDNQPVSTGGNNFTVAYDLVVTNPGPGTNTYTLTDTPNFGDGTTITSITVTGPDGDITLDPPVDGVYTLTTTNPIAAATTETYTVTVAFTVAADMAATERTCDNGSVTNGQGTFNSATITFTGGQDTDTDCADIPPALTIDKNLIDDNQPVSTGGNNFTVAYDLVVTNPGPGTNTYTLTDTPNFGDGTTITSITVTGPDGDITLDPPVDGVYTLTTTNPIAAATTETYTVTVAFTVAADMAATERTCDNGSVTNGQGTFNSATITFTGGQDTDTDCADIPDPDVTITKTVTSEAIPNGDGTSTVEYTVEVINALGAGPGVYDLADEPQFSQGIVVESKSVTNTVPGTIITDPTFDTSGQVVTGEAIGSNTTHRYVVSVTLSTAFTPELTYVQCNPDGFGPNEGLYNKATVTVDGVTTPADDCTDLPGDLTIDKDDGGVTVIAGGAPFTYTLTVTNVGGIGTGSPVTVTDVLPAEFEWVSFPNVDGDLPFCVQADRKLTCTIDPTLVDLGGESTSFEVTARALDGVDPSVDGYRNLSYVNSPDDPAPQNPACPVDDQVDIQPDALRFLTDPSQFLSLALLGGDPSNNVACDETPVIDGFIDVDKTDSIPDGDLVVNGQEFTYTLNVTNIGTSPLDTVTLADDLPVNIELISVAAGTGWTCNDADPIACAYAPELAAGDTTTDVVLTVKVGDAFVGAQIDNEVTSTAIVRTETDSKTVTDTDDEVTPLEPTLDVNGFVPVCVADAPAIQYNIVPKGFDPTTDTATLTVLDANGDPIDYNGDGVVNDADNLVNQPLSGSILWPGARVVDGAAVDWPGWRLVNGLWEIDPTDDFLRDGVFVTVSVNPEATTDLIAYPPSTSACADPEQTSADLQIVKTATEDIVEQGDVASFDLVVTNNGPDEATEVVVLDDVPTQLDVTAVTSSDFTCSNTGNSVRCTRPSLAVGDSGTITIDAIVNAGVVGVVSNTAIVTGRQPDPDSSNNTSTDTINVPEVDIDPPVPPTIPITGSNVNSMIAIALTMVMAGFALMLTTNKRRRQPAWPKPDTRN